MQVDQLSGPVGGIIKQIHVINFMCHDNFIINFNPRINFICGRNGSGKSAVQTALVIGLGGKAMWTGRGTSLKDLVKNGKNSCTIKITLNNFELPSYKPDLYGQQIIVERVILLSGSSSYKIKSEKGDVISRLKDELDKILLCFNIQINNPIVVLHQDVARNFLNSDDARKKYTFFNQATLQDHIEECHSQVKDNANQGLRLTEQKEELSEYFFQDIEELRNKMKVLQEAEEKVRHKDEVRNELSWAMVHEVKESLDKCLQQKEKINCNIQKLNNNIDRCKVDDDEFLLKKRDLEQEVNHIQKEIENTTVSLKNKREQCRQKNGSFELLKEELKQNKSKLNRLKDKVTAMEEMIYKATHPDPEMEKKKQMQQLKLDKLNEKLLDIESVIQTSEMEHNQLVETQEKFQAEISRHNNELKTITSEQSNRQKNIRLLKQETNNLSMYSNFMPKLVSAINAEKRFKEKPRGPIGAYVKVKDPMWAAAVEHFIGKGTLSAFCVSNQHDYQVLQKIINTVCSKDSIPTIFNSKFFYEVHNVQETTLAGYSNLLRGLEISDPVVANCLIDNVELETVLMIPTNEKACKIMERVENVPQYCKRGFTLKGDRYFPAPNYKSYGGKMKTNRAMLLQADKNDTIRTLEEEQQELFAKSKEVEVLKRDADHNYKQIKDNIAKKTNDLKNYRLQKQQLQTKIRDLEQSLENEMVQPMMPKQMETELHELQECSKQVESKIQSLQLTFDESKSEAEKYQKMVSDLEESLENFNNNKSRIEHDICKTESELRNKNTLQAQYQEKLKQHEALMISKDQKIDELTKEKAKLTEEAEKLSPEPIETSRSVDTIKEELRSLNVYLSSLEKESGGDLEQVTTHFQERVQAYEKFKAKINSFRESVSYTGEIINEKVKNRKKSQKQIAFYVTQTFNRYMSSCNFKGDLQFDHEAKELHINVSPKNEKAKDARSTASLSGGEKSYSTAAFIMSLWSHLQLPFYFLDEFDVFMDMVNRDRIMEMLIDRAMGQKKQFVFLTPLDMSKIKPSKDLEVFRLNAPREEQQ